MRKGLLFAVLLLSASALSAPAATMPAKAPVHAAAVYSQTAGGVWIDAYAVLTGCAVGIDISATSHPYKITVRYSGGPHCPSIARPMWTTRFFAGAAYSSTVSIDANTGHAMPYSEGRSDPEKTP